MNNPIIMQINYAELAGGSFGRRSIGDVCAFAKGLGFDGIEFRGKIPTDLDLSFREYAEKIAKGKRESGLSDILFGFNLLDCTNEEKRDAQIEDMIEKAKIVREVCGADVCNVSGAWISAREAGTPWYRYDLCGSYAAEARDWDLTADAFSRMAPTLEKIGLRFAFETHMGYVHDLPASARRLVDMIGSPMIGINLDYGNTVYFKERPTTEEAIDTCGDKLFYTHLKNSVSIPGSENLRLPTALGEGEINHRAYMQKLVDVGYTGRIGIEAPRQGDRIWYAKCDMAYMKDLLADFT
ncbi:MAG: sugar phosphate isomerase/epimerase [Ruminococcaceae bacterium]|nr:sugar phosphate isomerase/epimerase [Oscillospiraceae bacterium]